jgi:hypothetical protein
MMFGMGNTLPQVAGQPQDPNAQAKALIDAILRQGGGTLPQTYNGQ